MRFILKSAFWLGLFAFLVPLGGGRGETGVEISWLGALAGAQQAMQDIGGFCGRAPQACDTGREVAVFAGERIGDGLQLAYDVVGSRKEAPDLADAQAEAVLEGGGPRPTDPMMTGAVAPVGPRPYLAPKRGPAVPGAEDPQAKPAPASPAVPTPAPRG